MAGRGNGLMCIGYTKNARPIDCIRLCMHSTGDDYVSFVTSPLEALQIAHLIIIAVDGFINSDNIGDRMHCEKGYDFEALKDMLRIGNEEVQ